MSKTKFKRMWPKATIERELRTAFKAGVGGEIRASRRRSGVVGYTERTSLHEVEGWNGHGDKR